MIELKNERDVIDKIAESMMEHDVSCCGYQEDIYLYIDDNGIGSINIFPNIGGHSWLDDDHITVCCMREYVGDWTDTFTTEDEIAYALDCSYEHLIESVREWLEEITGDQFEQDEIGYNEVYDYVREHKPILEKIMDARKELIRLIRSACMYDYRERASEELQDALTEVSMV